LADTLANGITNLVSAVSAANASTEFHAHLGTLGCAIPISNTASDFCEGIQPITADACAFTWAIAVPNTSAHGASKRSTDASADASRGQQGTIPFASYWAEFEPVSWPVIAALRIAHKFGAIAESVSAANT